MTETVMFVDGVSYTETDQAVFNSKLRPQGILLDGLTGFLTIIAPGGMQVQVWPGEAMIQGFLYKNDANKNLSIASNASGSTRIDLVVIRLNRTANTCVAAIVQGIAGAGAPALTQIVGGTWEFQIASVSIASGTAAITTGMITDTRVYSQWPANTLDPAVAMDADVTAEASTRAAADTSEATTRANADTSEASTRASAITTEANARIAADNAEASTRATVDTNEANARSTADTNEATTRAAADTALGTRVTNETPHARGRVVSNALFANTGFAGFVHTGTGTYSFQISVSITNMAFALTYNGAALNIVFTVAQVDGFNFTVTCRQANAGTQTDSDFTVLVWSI